MGVRVVMACCVCRLTRWGLRLLHRGGTALPGKLALKLCPDVLDTAARGVQTVLVTGTNGKTTTVKLLCGMLEREGVPCFTNRSGANLASGITAEFIANATLTGRAKVKTAVIECDEAALKRVAGRIRPAAIVVTNLFRDQVDRYGDVTNTLAEVRRGLLAAPEAVACLNADCSLTASLAGDTPNPCLFFGMEGMDAPAPRVNDAPNCLRCGTTYVYDFHTFDHLGGFRCPDCGYCRPIPQVAVSQLSATADDTQMQLRTETLTRQLTLGLPGVYNVYNAGAACAALLALGRLSDTALSALADIQAGFGRMETMTVGDTLVRMILVKNASGCDRAMAYLTTVPGPFLPILCLNDRVADGTDISWLQDADFEQAAPLLRGAVLYGTRAGDLRARLIQAGVDGESLRTADSAEALVDIVRASPVPVYILPNYTTMMEVRAKLAAASGGKAFWE